LSELKHSSALLARAVSSRASLHSFCPRKFIQINCIKLFSTGYDKGAQAKNFQEMKLHKITALGRFRFHSLGWLLSISPLRCATRAQDQDNKQ
jgi:hypothetical protein